MKAVIIILFALFISKASFSQDFEVSPVVVKFNASPGEIQARKVSVRNHGNSKQQFMMIYSDYEIDSLGKKIPVKKEDSKHSCADWISINPSNFELNPNEKKEVDIIMTVPIDGDGAKWGKIAVQTATEQGATEADKSLATGVVIVPRIAIDVTQTPKGSSNYKGGVKNLVEITAPKDTLRIFSLEVFNNGGNILTGKVFLAVANVITAEEKKYSPKELKIYPGSTNSINLAIPERLLPGRYVVAAILDYGHRKPLEGTQIMIEQK